MSPGNKNAPPAPVHPSGCRLAQTRTARRAGPARNPSPRGIFASSPSPFHLYSRPRSHHQERANHISMTSSVQKRARERARVEGWRGRATRKVLCRGAPELAGFTRAVTKHLLSLAAVPRSRLPQARLPLVCYCLFFHRLLSFSSSFSSSSSSCSSAAASSSGPYLFVVLVSRRFHMEARPHCSKSRPSACVFLSLRLFTKRYSRYPFRQDSSMSEILIVVHLGIVIMILVQVVNKDINQSFRKK